MLEDYGQYQTHKTKKSSFLLSLLFYTGVCLASVYVIPQSVSNHLKTLHKDIVSLIPNGDKLHNMLFLALKPKQILFHQAHKPLNQVQQGPYQIETTCVEDSQLMKDHMKKLEKSKTVISKIYGPKRCL